MSVDLNELFAEAGLDGPVQSLDFDYIIRRGRRARARRRATAGATAVVGAGVVVLAGTTLASNLGGTTTAGATTASGPVATVVSPTTSPAPSHSAGIEEALTAVTLPDPAPGFPFRRLPDNAPRLTTLDGGTQRYWARSFMLAAKPEITATDSSGNVGGGTPTGPEITMLVGTFPAQPDATRIPGQTLSSHPQVAGVTGTALTGKEKGIATVTLYFKSGPFSVQIFGSGGATTEQLVALGNALTGLG